MLDSDLAELYGVQTFRLNEAVKRNTKRFPSDFMFELTKQEAQTLTSQFAMSKTGRGGRRTVPHAFTEQGVAMLSSVLNSERAVLVNIAIMRAFVKLREIMATHKDLAQKIEALERKYSVHDQEIQVIFKAIKKLLEPPTAPKRRIGFQTEDK
jgi:DnaJ-domain-containing protein 1